MASKKREQAKKLAAQGASAAKIERKTGVSSKAANKFVAKAAAPAPSRPAPAPSAPAPAPRISNKNSVGQNLRAASGANNVLSNKELLKISKKNDKNPEKVLEKAVGKGLLIGSGVVNKYQKGKYTDPRTAAYRSMANTMFPGAGFLDSPILSQLRNAGKQDKGSALFIGSKGSTATTLPRKMGLGKGAQPIPLTPSNNEQPVSDGTATTATDPIIPFVPEELPEEPMDPGPGMMSGGGMGAAGASKLGRAKSRLRKLGIYGRGTSLLGRGLQYGNVLNA